MSNRTTDGRRINAAVGSRLTDGRLRGKAKGKTGSPRKPDGGRESQGYDPPAVANPGNFIEAEYTADEVYELLLRCGVPETAASEVVHCQVGGGRMGDDLAHENEAPFPESLAEFFVRSFCPEGGVCCDPFNGSGTTGAVCLKWGRRFVGVDLRESQVQLSRRRIQSKQGLFDTLPT